MRRLNIAHFGAPASLYFLANKMLEGMRVVQTPVYIVSLGIAVLAFLILNKKMRR